jgi:hypothetical protein
VGISDVQIHPTAARLLLPKPHPFTRTKHGAQQTPPSRAPRARCPLHFPLDFHAVCPGEERGSQARPPLPARTLQREARGHQGASKEAGGCQDTAEVRRQVAAVRLLLPPPLGSTGRGAWPISVSGVFRSLISLISIDPLASCEPR